MAEDSLTQPELICLHCGYDLRGLDRNRCPECGEEFDPEANLRPRLPWARRSVVGRFRGYSHTVLLATFRSARIAAEINRPVSYRDAQLFRWITVVLAAIPLVIVGIILMTQVQQPVQPLEKIQRIWSIVALAGMFPFLAFFSGIGSYFFHPRYISTDRQNRAIALSYYACAPLAFLFLPCAIFGGMVLLNPQPSTSEIYPILGGCIGFSLVVALLLMVLLATRRLMKITTRCGPGRQIALVLSLPLLWIAAGLFFFGWLPGLVVQVSVSVSAFGK